MGKKNLKYKPTGKFIGIDTGFVQAATLLDIAAASAVERNDFELAAKIAGEWVKLSLAMKSALDPHEDGESEDDEDSSSEHRQASPVGFGVTVKDLEDWHGRKPKG